MCGYYGFGNAGDEAILDGILVALRRRFPEVEVTAVCYPWADLRQVTVDHGVAAVDVTDTAALVAAASGADLMVLGGGGLFQDYLPTDSDRVLAPDQSNLGVWLGYALTARLLGVPLAIWGVGVGPLTTEEGRRLTRLTFAQAASATVRSREARELLEEIGVDTSGVEVTADPAFLLDPIPGMLDELVANDEIPHEGALRVGVVLRAWEPAPEGWTREVAAALDRVVEEHDADVLFLPFQQSDRGLENDAHVALQVAAAMSRVNRRAVIHTRHSPSEKLGILAVCDVVVAMRFHGVVFAARGGVPPVALSYDPKVSRLMGDLDLPDLTLELDRVSADALAERVELALADLGRLAERVGGRAATLWERAERGADAALGVMGAPLPPPEDELTRLLGTLALHRAADLSRMTAEVRARGEELAARLRRLQEENAHLQQAYDRQSADFRQLLDSRAMRLQRRYWRLREKAGDPRQTAMEVGRRVLPASARRSLRRLFPSTENGEPAPGPEELAELRHQVAVRLEQILADHRHSPGFVVYPPGIGWTVDLFQRPQQMASAFTRLGYPVIYTLDARYREGLLGVRTLQPGLYLAYLPEELFDLLGAVPQPIYVSYVYNFGRRRHLDRPVTVYEHIDHLEVFEHVYSREDLQRWHHEALGDADVVVASAVDLRREVAGERPDTLLVPNGVDYDHFADPPQGDPPADMAPILERGAPVVGYYGAIAEWIDYDLVEAGARALPGLSFVLIGPDYDRSMEGKPAFGLPNVFWLGPKPYRELPAYLACFDVATIPLVVNEVTHAVSPLKLFEYMAGGKPVVTPPLREASRFRGVLVGHDREEYVEQLRRAVELGKDPEYVALLHRTARANTWEKRAGTILEAVMQKR